jgi:TonB-linked SusC/RagA family outer membrane protein
MKSNNYDRSKILLKCFCALILLISGQIMANVNHDKTGNLGKHELKKVDRPLSPDFKIQDKMVTGTITDTNNAPLGGATILEKGTTNGVQADFDGNYTITVQDGAVLVFSFIGFETKEITVGNQKVINVVLAEDAQALDEVVVTALGISKEKKALAYSVQEVASEELGRAANGNINTALQGKVAGVNITTTGGVGGNARFELRGPSSLQGADQVLWVIDGVPFSQNNTAEPGNLFGGFSNGGGLLDINPDDIETVSVLKGGQAAALYGTRGANGVVLITTKTGENSKGLGISYTGSSTFSTAAYFLDLQDEFGQGTLGVFNPNSRQAWGPRLDGSIRPGWTGEDLPYVGGNNLLEDFTRTAVNTRHAISFSNSNDKGSFRASVLSDRNEGVFANFQIEKLNFDVRATQKINDWLTIDTKISYIRNQGQQRPDVGFLSFASQINSIPANIRTQELSPGFILDGNNVPREILFGPNALTANANPNERNPYFVQIQNVNSDERNRMFGFAAANIKFNENFDLRLKYGLDFFRYQTFIGARNPDNVDPANTPFINTTEQFFKEENIEFLLNYKKDLGKDFSLGLSVGGNLLRNGFDELQGFSGQIATASDFFLNAGTNRVAQQVFQNREIQSVYGFLDLSYKDYLFLSATARNDWSSALASIQTDNDISYFYPSVGLSGLISEMVELPNWINYLKVRGDYAQLGKDTLPFQTNPTFQFSQGNFNILNTFTPNELVNFNLRPEISSTASVGLELNMFNNRFKLDATYYNERTRNQIVPNPGIGQSTGFTARIDNAGLIVNQGIEILATIVPVRTEDFNLGLTFNVARNVGTLESLITPENDGEFFQFFNSNTIPEEVRASEGGKLGDIFGFGYQRDANGLFIVGEDGLPVPTQDIVNLGNIQADVTGSIALDANYKNFSLSALFAGQVGGDIYSLTEADATASGSSLKTLSLGRDPFFSEGNLADGSPNVQIVQPEAYWARVSGITEEFIYDASFMKLAEFSLSYNIPSKTLKTIGNGVVQNVRLSLIGRNLFYLFRNTPGTVPDAGVFNSTFGAQALDFSPVPLTRSIGMALNINL